MDFPKLDKVRRSAAPLQLDVVDAYVAGRLSRREFIQRGAIVGLSMGSIGMVIAACGGTTTSPSASGAAATSGASSGASSAPSAGASAVTGGMIRIAGQRPV